MQCLINSNIEVTQAMRTQVDTLIKSKVSSHYPVTAVSVHLKHSVQQSQANVSVSVFGKTFQASSSHSDMYHAISGAIQKVVPQVQKHKGKHKR
ncbi:ribosome-associated translation inhibitor RaiA [Vibrio splendidus]